MLYALSIHRLRVKIIQYSLTQVHSGKTPVLSASSHFLIASASGESSNSVAAFISTIVVALVVQALEDQALVVQALVVQTIEVVLLSGNIIVAGCGVVSKPPLRT